MASTIKVDNVQNQPGTNIINKCGTTITLGASSDTVALASGASQTGFGRTGTVDWVTTPKVTGDSPITAVTGKGYFLNTTAGTITVNLPAGAAGSIVSLADYAATWQTNNVTVNANGTEKIGGVGSVAVTLNTEGQSVTFVYVDSTQGWINTMDSTSNVRAASYIVATVSGACNTLATAPCCANTKIATFAGPGTFCVSAAASSGANNVVSYMVVAGGGAGGADYGGGGGAGGFREYKSPVTPYTSSPLDGNPGGTAITVSATPYAIVVGGGGAPVTGGGNGSSTLSNPGNDSSFSTITSTAGGRGGSTVPSHPNSTGDGGAGGSGGGGSWCSPGGGTVFCGGAGNTPSVSPSQGFPGGDGRHTAGGGYNSQGGGGGATVQGTDQSPPAPGPSGRAGGAGATTSISASPTVYAGGGGGGDGGSAGPGGGGASAPGPSAGGAGTVNTGGGGGGATYSVATGAGGSGIVIIRYKFQ